jgi:hypothetical protein
MGSDGFCAKSDSGRLEGPAHRSCRRGDSVALRGLTQAKSRTGCPLGVLGSGFAWPQPQPRRTQNRPFEEVSAGFGGPSLVGRIVGPRADPVLSARSSWRSLHRSVTLPRKALLPRPDLGGSVWRESDCPQHCAGVTTGNRFDACSMNESPRSKYYIRTADGLIYGPFSSGELRTFALDGRLDRFDNISKSTTGPWARAECVSGLSFAGSVPEPIPTPPPPVGSRRNPRPVASLTDAPVPPPSPGWPSPVPSRVPESVSPPLPVSESIPASTDSADKSPARVEPHEARSESDEFSLPTTAPAAPRFEATPPPPPLPRVEAVSDPERSIPLETDPVTRQPSFEQPGFQELPARSFAIPGESAPEFPSTSGVASPLHPVRAPFAPLDPDTQATMSIQPSVTVIRSEKISSADAIQFGYDFLRRNMLFATVSCLLIAAASHLPGVGAWLVAAPLLIGFFQCIRAEAVAGTKPTVGAIFGGFRQFVPALLIGFWGSGMIMFGLACCCIPGIFLLPMPFFAFVTAARDQQGGIRALTRAIRVIEKDPFGLFLACILLFIVGLSGMLLCYVGMVLTLPIMLAGLYRVGDQMLESENA